MQATTHPASKGSPPPAAVSRCVGWLQWILLPLVATTLHAAPEGFTEVRRSHGITEYRLDANGLTVLLQPQPTAPVATFMVTYRIGSRNESYGATGATHLLEHLMFKGTPRHNKEDGTGIDQLLEATGAETNATTWLDRTNYFTTLAPQHLPLIVGIEADRMRNLRLREEDRRPEMAVVRSEFQIAENDPGTTLDTGVWATAFHAHPYRHSVLGWLSDVENVPIETLRDFYHTYYWPDNAVVSIVGNFDPVEALALVRREYGAIPRPPRPIPAVHTVEPPQVGPRRFIIKRPGELGLISIAYKIPPATHADIPALTVLADLLSNGLGSRFYLELTETGLTTGVAAYPAPAHDPSLFTITAEITTETTHDTVEQALLTVLRNVKSDGVTEKEAAHAIARLKAGTAFARDGSLAISESLTESIAVGDWTLHHTMEDSISKVTPEDIQRVANHWLHPDQSTTGWYLPTAAPAAAATASSSPPAPEPPAAAAPLILPAAPPIVTDPGHRIAPSLHRTRTGGIDLLISPSDLNAGVVTLVCAIPVGDPDQRSLAAFLAYLLQFGTTLRDTGTITDLLDSTGAVLEYGIEDGALTASARFLKSDLGAVIPLLAEQLRMPALNPEDIRFVREQMIQEATAERANTGAQAAIAFSREAFPVGHPNRLPTSEETIAAIKAIRRKDLVEFHRTWLGPAAATFVVVGDVDPAACQAEIAKSFEGWQGGQTPPAVAISPPPAAAIHRTLPIPGKESVSVVLGQPTGLHFSDPDTLPLAIATAALGHGFTSRLLNTIRDVEGLTYGIRAGLSGDTIADGSWQITASFAAKNLDLGMASTRRELATWHREGLSAGELAYHKSALAGRHRLTLASSEALAHTLLTTVRRGLDPSWLDDFPSKIAATTLDQVNEVIRRRIDPAKIIVIQSGTRP